MEGCILITGASGFIGTNLQELLIKNRCNFVNILHQLLFIWQQ